MDFLYSYGHEKGKYCSRKCAGKAVGVEGWRRITGKLQHHKCEQCEREFSDYYPIRKYCSQQCFYASPSNSVTGKMMKDLNHDSIVSSFKKKGASVFELYPIFKGCPDLLVGWGTEIYLVEIKNPASSYGRQGLSRWQKEFAKDWPVDVVYDEADVSEFLGMKRDYQIAVASDGQSLLGA